MKLRHKVSFVAVACGLFVGLAWLNAYFDRQEYNRRVAMMWVGG